ncbi:putative retrotransposon hot spot protein (RHS) [Trypanosoma cruzi]|uniref:Putative retrotransposon hot spot protein (RHS) n=1 Tax=Trypanosoma cruzi TaxID=5693 RepID=A0A2V2W668_TRYCR|nr:putative retrotransposon hot spot protein (RHS) [Trypanosoma cruzi]
MRKGTSWFSCAMRIAGIFHKACNCPPFCCVWEAAVIHRCCGVYDLGCLRVAVAAPNSLPTCVFVCVKGDMHARIYSCRVCAVTAVPQGCGTVASGMRGRTLRAHHVVVVGSLQHCAGWMAPTFRLCGGPRACGVHHTLCGGFSCCSCQSFL